MQKESGRLALKPRAVCWLLTGLSTSAGCWAQATGPESALGFFGRLFGRSTAPALTVIQQHTVNGLSVSAQQLLYANLVKSTVDLKIPLQLAQLKQDLKLVAIERKAIYKTYDAASKWAGVPDEATIPSVGQAGIQTGFAVAVNQTVQHMVLDQAIRRYDDSAAPLIAEGLGRLRRDARQVGVYADIVNRLDTPEGRVQALSLLKKALPELNGLSQLKSFPMLDPSAPRRYVDQLSDRAGGSVGGLARGQRDVYKEGLSLASQALSLIDSDAAGKMQAVVNSATVINDIYRDIARAWGSGREKTGSDANALALFSRLPPEQFQRAFEDGLLHPPALKVSDGKPTWTSGDSSSSRAGWVRRNYETMAMGVATFDAIANVSRILKLKPDVQRTLADAAHIGNAALVATQAFASGGPLSAALSLAGAASVVPGLGGTAVGPDPAIMGALQDLQKSVDKILEVQQDTLAQIRNLETLSRQQHRQVMTALKDLQESVETISYVMRLKFNQDLARECGTFQRTVEKAGQSVPGGSSLYKVLQGQAGLADMFVNCREHVSRATTFEFSQPYAPWLLPATSTPSNLAESPLRTWQDDFYGPAWELTKELTQTPRECEGSLTQALSKGAVRMEFVPVFRCEAAQELWKAPSDREFSGSGAMARYFPYDIQAPNDSANLLERTLQWQLLISPFYELHRNSPNRFATLEELRAEKSKPEDPTPHLLQAADLVALASAQESVLSGLAIADIVAERLKDLKNAKFDLGPEGSEDQKLRFAADCGMSDIKEAPEERSSARRLVCMLHRSPEMAANALFRWLQKIIPHDRRVTYALVMEAGDLDGMNGLLKELNFQADGEGRLGFVFDLEGQTSRNRWFFKLPAVISNHTSQKSQYIPLPSAFELEAGQPRLRPQAQSLRRMMQLTMAQLEQLNLRGDKSDPRLVQQIAAAQASMRQRSPLRPPSIK